MTKRAAPDRVGQWLPIAAFGSVVIFLLVWLWVIDASNLVARMCATLSLVFALAWFPLAVNGKSAWGAGKLKLSANSLFLLVCLFAYAGAVFVIPPGTAPDEGMRYRLTEFILEQGVLPRGDDPRLLDPTWGTSYAFLPYLSNLVGVLCQRIYLIFDPSGQYLLYAARMAGVLFGGVTAVFLIKIADRLFDGAFKWLMLTLAALLPQFVYIAGYLNNDGLATMAGAIVLYSWLCGIDTKWNVQSLVLLGVGLSVCALSYYNAYGYILCSAVLVVATLIQTGAGFGAFAKKVGVVTGVFLLLAGWWFVRQGILYDGDILGLTSSNASAELHAVDALKPSQRQTLLAGVAGIGDLVASLLLWLRMSWRSYFAVFGVFAVYVPYAFYYAFTAVGVVGAGGTLLRDKQRDTAVAQTGGWFKGMVALSALLPVALSLYNSVFVDFQPQGRYWMPGLACVMLLLTWGYQKLTLRVQWGGVAVKGLLTAVAGLFLFSVYFYLYRAY